MARLAAPPSSGPAIAPYAQGRSPSGDSKSVGNGALKGVLHRAVNVHPRFRRFLLRLFFPNRDVEVELLGARLCVNAQEEVGYIAAQQMARVSIPLGGDAGILATLALVIEPEDTFIDIGANVGFYSAVLARAGEIFPRIKLYAFEPHPDTVKRLRTTLERRAVEIHACALSDHAGELEFCEGGGSWTFGAVDPASPFQIRGRAFRVRAQRLDDVRIEGDSIVMKIDVENHEAEVLRGAARLLASGRVKAVYIDGYTDTAIPETLRELDFALFDGRTLGSDTSDRKLLAISHRCLARWALSKRDYKYAASANA
jgi:FkbM family methyltransferase